MENKSQIQQFYADAKVLITGGTGFLGKALIDKLLRTCPEIGHIYLIIRPKKGKDCDVRLKELFEDPVFERLKTEYPDYYKKVTCIPGDCAELGLGLSLQDREMLAGTITNVFHGAATVRFDEKLRIAVNINVRGVKEMLNFCRSCLYLKSIIHISTAYSNCPRKDIGEQFYEPPMSGNDAINIVSSLKDEKLDKITQDLLGEWPNTYAFTKVLAENIVKEYGQGLPIAIFRPAIVIASYSEPVPGWIDNVYGPTGVVVGVAAGLLRVLQADPECRADLVPVDMAVNALLCATWEVASKYNNSANNNNYERNLVEEEVTQIPIYNYVSSKQNPLTWGDFLHLNMKFGTKIPAIKAIWYYTLTLTKVKLYFQIMAIFMHLLPALLMDSALVLAGKKPMLWKAYKKIHKFASVISFFSTSEWNFKDDNIQNLWKILSKEDKKRYDFNMKTLDWVEFHKNNVWGIRVYLFKEDASTLPAARRKQFLLSVAHKALQFALYGSLLYSLYSASSYLFSTSSVFHLRIF